MKKIISVILCVLLIGTVLAGCGGTKETNSAKDKFDTSKEITVVSREDGSGTRGAFIELFGVQESNEKGEKVDKTTEEANITNNTNVMMTTVAGNNYAIGYISLGSLNDTVKAVKIDGVAPTAATIKDGSYKVSRPFNIATKNTVSKATQDFISYILSTEGQKIVEQNGYIEASDNATAYKSNGAKGKITIAGSSSVTPIMEKLKEAYLLVNKESTVEIQQSDSTTGMTSVAEGVCDIGMASRELKKSEISQGIKGTVIARDGIAVVVNKANTAEELKTEQVKSIFTGKTTVWSDIDK